MDVELIDVTYIYPVALRGYFDEFLPTVMAQRLVSNVSLRITHVNGVTVLRTNLLGQIRG
jgi:hypothetical protein